MIQEPGHHTMQQQELLGLLQTLSFREQLDIVLRTTRHLPQKEKAIILGGAGRRFLSTRFLPIVLHFLFDRLIKWFFWSGLYVVLLLAGLVCMAYLEQVDARAVTPVVITGIAFVMGFVLAAITEIGRSIYLVLRTTVTKQQREQLVGMVNALPHSEKMSVLKTLSGQLSSWGAEPSLLAVLFSGCVPLLVAALLVVVMLIVSSLLPALTGVVGMLFLIVVAVFAFLCGFFGPRLVQNMLFQRRNGEKYRA